MTTVESSLTLYVIDLKKSVLLNRKFREANPGYLQGKACVYVGVTSHAPEKRFEQHMNGVRFRYSPIIRRYGKRLRTAECRKLRAMTRARAEKKEAAYAERLRVRGWAVWSN